MCILITSISPRRCCRKELLIRCHLDQFSEFLYAKAGRTVSDKCPKTTLADTPWNCMDDCKRMYHEKGERGQYWGADFNSSDDYDFLKSVRSRRRRYDHLATVMKNEFTEKGASDAAVAKAIQNLNDLPEDATLGDKAEEFSAMGFKIIGRTPSKEPA